MSEQTIQDGLYSEPVTILDKYTCYSLGATTINDLIRTGKLSGLRARKSFGKKPDVLIVDRNRHVIVFCEFKTPAELDTDRKIEAAIAQEIAVSREVGAKIYVVSDGSEFIWINPATGNRITDENGDEVHYPIKPKEEQKKLADFIERVMYSITDTNDAILPVDDIDPTDLAVKIGQILKKMTFASSKMSLYTFVEVFLFKYLSDIGILSGTNSFSYIAGLYKGDDDFMTDADILGAYLEGPREQMKMLFPAGKDNTSIVNGQIFHARKDVKTGHYIEEDSHALCFRQIIKEFVRYEKKNGKFINISRDFKSRLFETFMKNSDDRADMGQFFTPLKIVSEMVEMVDVFPGAVICDPASGVGKFLLEAAADSNADYEIKRDINGDPVELKKGITLVGYEKQMSGNDDITTILAKANMLIYFSRLFRENNDAGSVMFLTENLLNDTFCSFRTALGSLAVDDKEKYDIILANPPYYQEGTISSLARATGLYSAGGQGIEGLFLEWIIRSLKKGGTANIVIPDGILLNLGNDNLKRMILSQCFIESLISLPIDSFFNTNKKTYILTIHKKTQKEMDDGAVQDHKVFTYLCSSIGETLDKYRLDTDDNDLHEAVIKYNQYRSQADRNNIAEPFRSWFLSDRRLKFVDISIFNDPRRWNIDDLWSDEEKVTLGIKKEEKSVSVGRFCDYMESFSSTVRSLKEELASYDVAPADFTYTEVPLTYLFTPANGDSRYTKTYCAAHHGEYPIFSGNTAGPYDHIDSYDYDGEYLTWAKDGLAGYLMVNSGKFSITGHRGILLPADDCKDIDLAYIKHILEPVFRAAKKGRQGDLGKNEYTTLNIAMIRSIKTPLKIPVTGSGAFDLEAQKRLAAKYAKADAIKERIARFAENISEMQIR